MALISWDEFRFGESSAATRAKRDVANGLKPLAAMSSPFSHSTDNPAIEDKLLNMLKDDKKKSKKKKDEAVRTPHYDFDSFIKRAERTKDELESDKEKAKEDEEAIDKKKSELQNKEKTAKVAQKKTVDTKAVKPQTIDDIEDKKEKEKEEKDKNEWTFLCGELI